MDVIERRSWLLSVALHAVLVVVSLVSFGVPVLALRPTSSPAPAPAAPATAAGEVVLAPDSGPAALPPLPPLGGQPAVQGTAAIAPAPTSFPGAERSRGDQRNRVAPVLLPQAEAVATPLGDALRGQRSNPRLSAEAASRATGADHLDYIIGEAYRRLWRGYASQITNRILVIEVEADGTGTVHRAGLFHCTTGVPELDRAITAWLVQEEVNLPRLLAGQVLRFVVVLP